MGRFGSHKGGALGALGRRLGGASSSPENPYLHAIKQLASAAMPRKHLFSSPPPQTDRPRPESSGIPSPPRYNLPAESHVVRVVVCQIKSLVEGENERPVPLRPR